MTHIEQRMVTWYTCGVAACLFVVALFDVGARQAIIAIVSSECGKNALAGIIVALFVVIFVDTRKERREEHRKKASMFRQLVGATNAEETELHETKLMHVLLSNKASGLRAASKNPDSELLTKINESRIKYTKVSQGATTTALDIGTNTRYRVNLIGLLAKIDDCENSNELMGLTADYSRNKMTLLVELIEAHDNEVAKIWPAPQIDYVLVIKKARKAYDAVVASNHP